MSNEMKPETPLDAAWAEYVQEREVLGADAHRSKCA